MERREGSDSLRERAAGGPMGAWLGGEAAQVAAWVLVALVLRLVMLGFESVLTPDGVMYAVYGRHFGAGRFASALHPYYPPLYPMLIGLVSHVVTDLERAGQLISVAAGSLTVVPVYLLARGAYGRRVGVLAALLTAVHPLLLHYSVLVLTEAIFTFLFACAVVAGWRALETGRARLFAVSGLAFGLCYLLKPEAAGFVPLLLALAVLAKLLARRQTWRGLAAGSAAFVAGFLVPALPYILFLHERLGRWTISGKVAGHMWGYARVGNSAAIRGGQALDVVPGTTTMLVQLTKALKQEYEYANFIFPPLFVLVAGLGLFRTRWTRARAARELYLLSFVLATAAGYAVTQANIRSFVPLVPLLLVWVAVGIFEAEAWLAETLEGTRGARLARLKGGWPARLLVAFALTLTLVPLAFYLKRGDAWADYGGQKRVALWIKEHHTQPKGPIIMSSVPIPGFYAVGDFRKLEVYESYPNMIEQARRGNAEYILINERDFRNQPLAFLLDESAAPPAELRLVHKYRDPSGYRFFVYQPAWR